MYATEFLLASWIIAYPETYIARRAVGYTQGDLPIRVSKESSKPTGLTINGKIQKTADFKTGKPIRFPSIHRNAL